jgi:hypothetical protein
MLWLRENPSSEWWGADPVVKSPERRRLNLFEKGEL